MPLRKLSLTGKNIRDLKFLKGKSLTTLRLNDTSISDLSALRGMPLEVLLIGNTLVDDLTPIYDMDIRELNISGLPIKDYSFLKRYRLRTLHVAYSGFSDLSILTGQPLKLLDISYSKVKNITTLAQLKDSLVVLYALGCRIDDIRPLRALALEQIALTPHMCPSNWMSVLQSINSLKSVMGSQDEIRQQTEVNLKEFIRRTQRGTYQ